MQDPRFDDEVDRITGYHTETLLCMPVRNAYDEIIAVAQVINKNPDVDGGIFTKKDEKVFETYLQFVGIAITNAQIMETSRQEYDRNRVSGSKATSSFFILLAFGNYFRITKSGGNLLPFQFDQRYKVIYYQRRFNLYSPIVSSLSFYRICWKSCTIYSKSKRL